MEYTLKIINRMLESVELLKNQFPNIGISILSKEDRDSDGIRFLIIATKVELLDRATVMFNLSTVKEDIKSETWRPVAYHVSADPLTPKSITQGWTLEATF